MLDQNSLKNPILCIRFFCCPCNELVRIEINKLSFRFVSPFFHILICDLVVVASVPNDLKDPHDEPLDGFHGEAEVWRRTGGVRLKQLGERIF